MIKRSVALVALLLLVFGLAGAGGPAALGAPPLPAAGFEVEEVPALPWQDQQSTPKQYIQVPAAQAEANRNAHAPQQNVRHKLPPPAPATAQAVCTDACYTYGRLIETADADKASGMDVTITTGKPFVPSDPGWEHSLGENAIQANNGDIIEVGWTVDRLLRADGNPTLFAFHWIAGVPTAYNFAFNDFTANPINLGAGLPNPVNKRFFIGSTSTAFWVGYDNAWVAWVAKSRFGTGSFSVPGDSVEFAQAFYEIASEQDHTCVDMGTGWDSNPIASGSGSIYNFTWTNSATPVDVSASVQVPTGVINNPDAFNFVKTGSNAGRGGGPGYTLDGLNPGTRGAC